jgi:hypothetical protein
MTEHDRPTHQTHGVAPHDAPATPRPEPALPTVHSGMYAGRNALGRFGPGNAGRPKGAVGKRRQTAIELFDRLDFDPLEKKILLCQTIDDFPDAYVKVEYLKLYSEALRDVLQYGYQKQKAVEHFGQLEIIQKLQALDDMSDDELRQLLSDINDIDKKQLP